MILAKRDKSLMYRIHIYSTRMTVHNSISSYSISRLLYGLNDEYLERATFTDLARCINKNSNEKDIHILWPTTSLNSITFEASKITNNLLRVHRIDKRTSNYVHYASYLLLRIYRYQIIRIERTFLIDYLW